MLTDFAWVKQNLHCVPAKSKTANGLTYSLNQEKYLRTFLEDGAVPMDNNAAEQSIRPFCVGIIISNIFWKKSLGTWMNMVWISVKICFPGQIRCQWNAESNLNDMPLFGAVAYVGVPTMERLRTK